MAQKLPRDSVEAVIASRWQDVVGQAPESIDTDFFDAGYSSLQAVKLMVLLQEEFGKELSVQAIFDRSTVASLAQVVRDGGGHRRYVFTLQRGEGVPLILGPGLGGGPAYISKLAVPEMRRPVLCVITKGVHGECPPYRTIEETSAHFLDSLHEAGVRGPVHLVGHCQGGLSVLHAARNAEKYGLEVRSVVLINTSFAMPGMSRMEMTKIRLQEIRGFAGLPDSPETEAADETADVDDLIRQVFSDVKDSGALWESSIEAFKVRLDVYVSSWQAACGFQHDPSGTPIHVMYEPYDVDWLYGVFDGDAWLKGGYPNLTVEARPGMLYADIGCPEHVTAVGEYLKKMD